MDAEACTRNSFTCPTGTWPRSTRRTMEGDIACGHWTGNAEAWEGKGLVCGWVSASRAPFLKVQGRNVLGKVCVCARFLMRVGTPPSLFANVSAGVRLVRWSFWRLGARPVRASAARFMPTVSRQAVEGTSKVSEGLHRATFKAFNPAVPRARVVSARVETSCTRLELESLAGLLEVR